MIAPGRRLGRYELRAAIGAGGMSAVWRAYDPTLDREVAIKILPADLASQEIFRKRFEEEARALGRVEHPHLIRIYAVGQERGVSFYAMELIEGLTLSRIMRLRRLTQHEAQAIFARVLKGLQAIHRAGIIHRDIKPSNIMLDETGRPLLMDFGLARRQERQMITAAGSVLGTPEYMSPEQACGKPADARSDIYSAGIVLYEMLAGRPPFAGPDTIAILRRHVESTAPAVTKLAPDTPASLAAIVHKMLAKKPDERYASVTDVLADLEGQLPPEAQPETLLRQLMAAVLPVARQTVSATRSYDAAPVTPASRSRQTRAGRERIPSGALYIAAIVIAGLAILVLWAALMRAERPVPAPAPATTLPAVKQGRTWRVWLRDDTQFSGTFEESRVEDGIMITVWKLPTGEVKEIPHSQMRRFAAEEGGDAP